VVAFVASDWSFDKVPAERIDEADCDLVDLDFVFFGFHEIFQEFRIFNFLF
jgi:hypothetical protein